MIEIRNLHKSYSTGQGTVEVLKGIDLTIEQGAITAVVGPSGAGKTTLSHCISLLEKPTSGQVLVDGRNLSALSGQALRSERRAIGTIFQHSALLRRMTVAENVALPLRNLGVVHREMEDRVAELLDRVGLLHKASAYPGQLSGGQKQRVGIARALALRPRILLSDESTSGLDPESTQQILDLLDDVRTEMGLSVILITHEMDVVRHVADQVAVLANGRVSEYGPIGALVADPGSGAGRQLLPVRALPLPAGFDYALSVSYRHGPVDPEWLTRLSTGLGVRVALLGGSVEAHGETVLGRAEIGVAGRPEAEVRGYLEQLGLVADPGAAVSAAATASPLTPTAPPSDGAGFEANEKIGVSA
ncbi:methionine ABC transporter ATP-binding protein [Arthrobacter sulfonylureivorans]|uniref:methionine ABC transporter ATP-binding protein n=1 Tax=Arthrobacter sulfonylureivorans TaxID=2486855 RepID=UPI0039E3C8C6